MLLVATLSKSVPQVQSKTRVAMCCSHPAALLQEKVLAVVHLSQVAMAQMAARCIFTQARLRLAVAVLSKCPHVQVAATEAMPASLLVTVAQRLVKAAMHVLLLARVKLAANYRSMVVLAVPAVAVPRRCSVAVAARHRAAACRLRLLMAGARVAVAPCR